MRIAFVIPSMGPGGAERVASLLCSYWSQSGHKVTLVTFEATGKKPFFDVAPNIELRQIAGGNRIRGFAGVARTNARRIRHLRSAFIEFSPDVIIAFMTEANVIALIASRGLGIPTIVSERNQPDRPGLGPLRKLIRRLCYHWSTAFVAPIDEIAVWARKRFRSPVYVLPNPVMPEKCPHEEMGSGRSTHEFVASGRLVPQKGFDLLIESFAQFAPDEPDCVLTIYGEGPMRSSLEAAIRDRGLGERVSLPGVRRDMRAALRRASLFVLPSRFEGYPNILLEALACGCPVIATDCAGPRQILERGRYGVLVPPEDTAQLAAAMRAMIGDRAKREDYSARAPEAVRQLNVATIAERWIELLSRHSS